MTGFELGLPESSAPHLPTSTVTKVYSVSSIVIFLFGKFPLCELSHQPKVTATLEEEAVEGVGSKKRRIEGNAQN